MPHRSTTSPLPPSPTAPRRKSAQLPTTSTIKRPTIHRRGHSTSTTHLPRLSSRLSSRRQPRPAPEESDTYASDEESNESFLNFCTTCDRQLLPSATYTSTIYCSSACQEADSSSNSSDSYLPFVLPASPPLSPFSMARDYATAMHGAKEGRDIIPRAKPSQVYGQPDWYPSYTVAPTYTEKSALNSLRSLHKMLSPEVEKPSAYLGKEELEVEEVRYLSSEEEGESAGSDEESDEGSEDEEEFGGEKRRYSSTPYMAGTYIGEEVYRPSLAESWALTGRP